MDHECIVLEQPPGVEIKVARITDYYHCGHIAIDPEITGIKFLTQLYKSITLCGFGEGAATGIWMNARAERVYSTVGRLFQKPCQILRSWMLWDSCAEITLEERTR